ncbi:MAG: peptidoglycan bridge formation glycyltransferase FemA/FemB family protein [Patescibacteria group bacterium]|jgi:lipid II:glycine glycyltransferase (peptidoglycan interpeptide bridge formation enzyme)
MKRVTVQGDWNEEVLRLGGDFLQSWEWGTFQEKAGAEIARWRGENALALLVKRSLPFSRSYWYSPRGPLGAQAIEKLTAAGALTEADFFRCEPKEIPERAKKTNDVQPGQTLIVDLRQDTEALMAAMHEKWRYNIRLAERKGVKVFMAGGHDPSAIEIFWQLMSETTERDQFRAHDKAYYQQMLETLSGDPATDGKTRPVARLVFAEHDGKVLAANLMLYFGTTATYLHGASSRDRREVMAPQALHWQAMQDAKVWGYANYDFWGVAPEGAAGHSWAGITRFKRGFGGRYVSYPGTFDLPLNRFWYTVYAFARRLRP